MKDTDRHGWDARAYDVVSSGVQLEWGKKLLEKRKWAGNETVMDAGAGSASLTKILAGKVPSGMVYAVDADPNMIQEAKANLSDCRNVQVIQSRMDDVSLPSTVDIIFSNAAFHWVLDPQKAFSHFWRLLKPGGELLIECGGGHGNLEKTLPIVFRIMNYEEYKEHFASWKPSWYYLEPGEAEGMLKYAGFCDIDVKLASRTTFFSDDQSFAVFVRTVILQPFLGYIPDAKKKSEFLDSFFEEFSRLENDRSLDFMLLNIFARK